MEQIVNYIKPELLIVAIVLYFLGMWLKQAAFMKDKYIPLVLGMIGVVVCGVWVASTAEIKGVQDFLTAVFAAFTQGVMVAGLSTYVNQIVKQMGKEE